MMLIDNQRLFAECLAGILKVLGRGVLERTMVVPSAEAGLGLLGQFQPDVVLVDLFIHDQGGLRALEAIKRALPTARVFVLAPYRNEDYVKQAVARGASGFLLKSFTPQEVWEAVTSFGNPRRVWIEPSPGHESSTGRFGVLLEKERKILLMVAQGLSNDEIAARLKLESKTIRNNVSALYHKLGVKDRFQAIQVAVGSHLQTLILE